MFITPQSLVGVTYNNMMNILSYSCGILRIHVQIMNVSLVVSIDYLSVISPHVVVVVNNGVMYPECESKKVSKHVKKRVVPTYNEATRFRSTSMLIRNSILSKLVWSKLTWALVRTFLFPTVDRVCTFTPYNLDHREQNCSDPC